MDPRERADAALARARARGAFVVTPESAVSPMDAANTLQLPRIVVADNDARYEDDPDATLVVPIAEVRDNVPAIAQEALTDVVGSPPGIRSRQRRIEDAIARGAAVRQQKAEQESMPPAAQPQPQQQPVHVPAQPQTAPAQTQPVPVQPELAEPQQPAKPAAPEAMDGLIPTTKQHPAGPGSLSERLDG